MLQGETHSINVGRFTTFLANAKNKTPPGGDPRAFALPREIGVTDLHKWNQSGE